MLTLLLAVSAMLGYSQEAVDVTRQTFKIGAQKSEKVWVGFAAGDQIIFNCSEAKNRGIQKIEIFKYPNTTSSWYSFAMSKSEKIENKTLTAPETGVYVFCFIDSHPRECNVHIQRIPASEETKHFNTTVKWKEISDTVYKNVTEEITVYDTTYEEKRTLLLEDSTRYHEDKILETHVRVNSKNAKALNKQTIPFTIPKLDDSFNSPRQSREFVAWVYWIGVGKESQEEWNKNVRIMKNLASGVVALAGLGPLAGLAVNTIADFAIPTKGDAVSYRIYNANRKDNDTLWRKGTLAYGKILEQKAGDYLIELENLNKITQLGVDVRVSLIYKTTYYEVEKGQTIKPRKKTITPRKPFIRTRKFPVVGEE